MQVLTMGQLVARLAGGLLRPVDSDVLVQTAREALSAVDMGELEPIKDLPGMPSAVAGTLDKVWRAGVRLAESGHPRLAALARLEEEIVGRLPASMRRPSELVELASLRLELAKTLIGPVEIHGHSEMSPCWRPFLARLAEVVSVKWMAGARRAPPWLVVTKVVVEATKASGTAFAVRSCANQQHEVIEAFRWIRSLLAGGTPASDIAIVASSPGEYDDHVLAQAADSALPIHFVHGVKAVTVSDGQAVAALAEILLKGISQERLKRYLSLAGGAPALHALFRKWVGLVPSDAPLTTLARWEGAFKRVHPSDWPDGQDRSAELVDALRLLVGGADRVDDVGETLLAGTQRALWRRALMDGPAAALPVTLGRLRVDDGVEPASSVLWTSAIALASSPRPNVWLLGMNAGSWPRRISEDRLIPDHVLSIEELDPLPIADGDKRDFDTIVSSASNVMTSFSRRDAGGRLLGRSPLISASKVLHLDRARTPEHAFSEADRLLARAQEFAAMPVAVSGLGCWRDWYRDDITPHDGLIAAGHERLRKLFERPLSATSLKLLLRDPMRFVWRYALGWKAPEDAEEPTSFSPLHFGNLVHASLRGAVNQLEASGGLAGAGRAALSAAIDTALVAAASDWESELPIPPNVIWRDAIDKARAVSLAALSYPLPQLPGQQTWTEIPFGRSDVDDGVARELPWKRDTPVKIPGTKLKIEGLIDRLDLSEDRSKARVIDYKTGKASKKMPETIIKGGSELQRCLYAFAGKELIGSGISIEAALLFPKAPEGEGLFPLDDVDAALRKVAAAAALAHDMVMSGFAALGTDANDAYNDLALALPASAGYLPRKMPLAQVRLGQAANVWSEP
ncbi:PD-(D/E)XK nuclease family protein [Bradyrhizobium sp. CCGB12]|uniref:PD-(D/E)XK nuclease family protein n=1 Tax=Bradyrhizobium sp. CCGB12 TaxID=2949632 RepID=UPI0020B1DE13|nr:PD-(D/E)XK nuclease family protein [Bradyrhizobium sp. CCGB12]MCP3393904.1 PD-(D/E)XK nuclease family protein [Bradyrhizobium sp. CCGB12]